MISEKVQVLIELLKQGNGASAAASDLRAVETQFGRTSSAANSLRNTLAGLFAGVSAGFVVTEIVQTTLKAEQMQNTLRSVAGSSQGAAREFGFVRQEAGRLGLALDSSVSAYARLSAAAQGTSMAGADVKEIFTGIAEAGTVLGLSAEQQAGALQAIQQMISKGTVAAEELRGQLGERLPGAFQIAARAMGVTTQELGKMLELGQVVSADFLPKFAAELRKTFADDAARSANSLNSELNRMKTAFFELKAALGTDARGFIVTALGATTETLQLLTRNKEAIQSMALVVGILAAEIAALTVVQRANITTTALFGAGWLKSAADVAAATSLIAGSTVSMAATVTANIALITTAIWAAVRAYQMLEAQSAESASKDALIEQTEMRRKRLENEISLAQQLGQITERQAAEMRSNLQSAFDAKLTWKVSSTAFAPDFGGTMEERSEPNVEARQKAMAQVSRALNPAMVPKVEEPEAPKSVVNTEAKQESLRSMEQLRSLQERMFIESLAGLEQDEARIHANFEARERQIEQLNKKLNLGTEELAQLRDLNAQVLEADRSEVRLREQQKAKAEEQKRKSELERQANEELQRLEQQLTTQAIGSSETRIQQAQREFNARMQLIGQLFAAGKIDAERWNQLSIEAANNRAQAMAAAVEAGQLEAEKLEAIRNGEEETTIEIRNQFEIRRQNLEAYYDFEIEKALGNADQVRRIEAEKAEALQQLNERQRIAASDLAQGMIQVGNAAQGQFAGGMARAFVSIADGSKSAKEAFADFARNFLRMIAEMILQTLILIAVRMALKSIPGVGAFLSGGGQVAAAKGGLFESLRMPAIAAAAGVAMAASGIEGVAAVNSPTYLPKFNVLAGEAGREVLTVMAKPQLIESNGVKAIVGSVGTKQVAMMSAEDMLAMGRPRMMAAGGFTGMNQALPSAGGSTASGGRVSGNATVNVALSPDLRATIVRDAIEGAVVRVTQEMQQHSALSSAVKRLVN